MEQNPVEFLGRRSAGLLLQARQALAQAMGATADELVFVPNSTTGVSTIARSFPLQEGDEVLTTDLEYGACDAAWQHVCLQAGAVYRRIKIPLPFDRESVTEHSCLSSKQQNPAHHLQPYHLIDRPDLPRRRDLCCSPESAASQHSSMGRTRRGKFPEPRCDQCRFLCRQLPQMALRAQRFSLPARSHRTSRNAGRQCA